MAITDRFEVNRYIPLPRKSASVSKLFASNVPSTLTTNTKNVSLEYTMELHDYYCALVQLNVTTFDGIIYNIEMFTNNHRLIEP